MGCCETWSLLLAVALISYVSDLVQIMFSLDISFLIYKIKSFGLNHMEDSDVLSVFLSFFFFWSFSKCSNTTLLKVYSLAVFFSLSVSFFKTWPRRVLSKPEGKQEGN